MRATRFLLILAAAAVLAACGTTDSSVMYDPNAPVRPLEISSSGTVDAAARSIAIPPGDDELLAALRSSFSADGWAVTADPGKARYNMVVQMNVWTSNEKVSEVHLSIVDVKSGAEILKGDRKAYSPEEPIDVKGLADYLVASLKKITSQAQ